MVGSRRYFGNIRKRESGRYQARYRAPDGRLRSAPHTFVRKSDAVRWLALKEAEIKRGDWIDPDRGSVTFRNYADQWLQDRVLKVRTVDLYRALLRNHLLPTFGDLSMADIDEASVRRWRKERWMPGLGLPGRSAQLRSPRHTGCYMRSLSRLQRMTGWFGGIRAGSRALALKSLPNARLPCCPSCLLSPMHCPCATG